MITPMPIPIFLRGISGGFSSDWDNDSHAYAFFLVGTLISLISYALIVYTNIESKIINFVLWAFVLLGVTMVGTGVLFFIIGRTFNLADRISENKRKKNGK